MAHLHFKRTVYRSGAGRRRSGIEYITRQPEHEGSAYDRQARYIAREDREDLVYERSRNLPAWAEGNPHTYFRAAERTSGRTGWPLKSGRSRCRTNSRTDKIWH